MPGDFTWSEWRVAPAKFFERIENLREQRTGLGHQVVKLTSTKFQHHQQRLCDQLRTTFMAFMTHVLVFQGTKSWKIAPHRDFNTSGSHSFKSSPHAAHEFHSERTLNNEWQVVCCKRGSTLHKESRSKSAQIPSSKIRPLLGWYKPVSSLIKVVLPAPLFPTSANP